MRRVLVVMARRGLLVELEGSGLAIEQNPAPGRNVPPGTLCQVRFAKKSRTRNEGL